MSGLKRKTIHLTCENAFDTMLRTIKLGVYEFLTISRIRYYKLSFRICINTCRVGIIYQLKDYRGLFEHDGATQSQSVS